MVPFYPTLSDSFDFKFRLFRHFHLNSVDIYSENNMRFSFDFSVDFHLKLCLAFVASGPDLPRPLDLRHAGLMVCMRKSFTAAAFVRECPSLNVES